MTIFTPFFMLLKYRKVIDLKSLVFSQYFPNFLKFFKITPLKFIKKFTLPPKLIKSFFKQ